MYAQEQGVSRATIENAWGELVAQGWLERRGQAGTFVSERLSPRQLAPVPPAQPAAPTEPLPFQMGLPALDLFPRGQWARVMGRRLRTQSRFDLRTRRSRRRSASAPGYRRLSTPVAQYRLSAGSGVDHRQLCRLHEPYPAYSGAAGTAYVDGRSGYPFIRPVVEAGQLAVDAIPVDDEGMDVGWGQRHHPQARFALLTPAHQSPLGVALSLPRRRQLLAWAAERDAWIIEDDYDSEFRYHGKPLPPLKSLDAPQRVIYAGTFSKSMFPALRTAWLVVPIPLVARFHQTAERQSCTVPTLWQQTLADFIQQGHFWRHLKKMRASYSQRRQWLESALQAQGFQVTPQLGELNWLYRSAATIGCSRGGRLWPGWRCRR